ncbi:EF-hand domain-containing protein [Lysobacter solisilvae (ex Woo and Kim 2020)]|uniref:EF-hand domain-containing protein n=1 Tax=Agrilutibacter terrestris TaxID=2865112 RepID=A0A7H0FZN4_9GAMM|nr:EF-hand domain-containing protein [Lysobacter terrestris]QNP41500.1 EF-hand domain-containing protein [Lysobacter terrestris]
MNRKSLIGAFALAATLSAPLAFAQSPTGTATDASMQSSTTTDASAQAATTNAQATTSNDASAATSGDPSKKSWNDIDLDKSGSLSKAEAAAIPALGQVFDKADSNADGALSADEYKAYVGKGKGAKK